MLKYTTLLTFVALTLLVSPAFVVAAFGQLVYAMVAADDFGEAE